MSTSAKSENMKLAPVRTVADFILDGKRYLSPALSDLKRANNRIVSNLLYYQTNYFIFSSTIFTIFLLFRFAKILAGACGISTTVAVVLFALNKLPQLNALKAQYPGLVPGGIIFNFLVVYMTFQPIIYLTLVLLVPFALWLIHASVRSRGLKNKVSNKMDQMGASIYSHTPMGVALASLGIEAREYDD